MKSFEAAWGSPDSHEPPSGEMRQRGPFRGKGKGKGTRPPGEETDTGSWPRPLGKFIRYKTKDIYLSGLRGMPADLPAQYTPPSENGYARVQLNSRDPLRDLLAAMPAALELHIVRAIIEVVEADEYGDDPGKVRSEVQSSLILYLKNRKKRSGKKK